LGVVSALLSSLVALTAWGVHKLDGLESSVESGHVLMRQIRSEAIKRGDFDRWNFDLQINNPSLKVPHFDVSGGMAPEPSFSYSSNNSTPIKVQQ
jgi:hypothetical protein